MYFKKEKLVFGKFSKQRLTGLAPGNAFGQKLHMFIISKPSKTRRFENLKHIPCRCRGQKRSWMECDLFEDWICEQDHKFEGQNRKVLLIVDNCPAHHEIGSLHLLPS